MEQAPPDRLSRDRIVQTAIDLVGAEGLTNLSMRRLGAALGVEAMALYRYVNGREDLLEAMVEALASSVPTSAEMDLAPDSGWQAYLQTLAHALRDLAYEHPQLFPLLATRHPAAPWLRPPLRSLELVEDFLDALTSRGFSDADAVAAYRGFTSFLLGHLLLAVIQRSGLPAVGETLDEGGAAVTSTPRASLTEYPNIARLEGLLSQDHADEEFEAALERLLDALDAQVSQ